MSAEASAADTPRASEPEGATHQETSKVAGLKGIQENIADGVIEHGGGVGVYGEQSVIEGWLDVEVNGSIVWFDRGRAAPFEFLAKKSFFAGRSFTPYAGLGPTLSIEDFAKLELHAGAVAVVGTYVWWSEQWGIDIDASYSRFVVPRASQELTLGVGSAYRF